MLHKLLAIIKKEFLILIRDKIGLLILFAMPITLILVMTLIQDSAFKTINEKGIPIVFVNNDHDTLGNTILNGLKTSNFCEVSTSKAGKPYTLDGAQQAVANGEFLIGIVIPEGASTKIRNNVKQLVSETMALDEIKSSGKDIVDITLIIDPVAKNSFVTTITSNLHEYIAAVKTQMMFQSFSDQIAEILPEGSKKPTKAYEKTDIIQYKEIYGSALIGKDVPTSTQHNVPAWTIFGMFFIVILVVGNIIKEKKEGSAFRLKTLPTSYLTMMNGKIIVYVIVCLIQFFIMIAVGVFVLPLFGLPPLNLGHHLEAILLLAFFTALAATGFGVLIGTLANSEQQGAILGSLLVLLLSAIGGILVPTYVMPEIMRKISMMSPLNWSLSGFYKIILRGAGLEGILFNCTLLFVFFIITVFLSSLINHIRSKS
ncbi:MAG: ABC transporter permease [Crocinitomicaceae bacterium]|nr:ABC transporter permease [Crocinitomicaceae bacterium]